jgi:hypothetical protein
MSEGRAAENSPRFAIRLGAIGDDQRGRAAIEAGCVAGRDRAAFAEGRTELGQPFNRRVRSRRLVGSERLHAFLAPNLDRNDSIGEFARLLGRTEALTGNLSVRGMMTGSNARGLGRDGLAN